MSEIIIHFFEVPKKIFEQIFKGKEVKGAIIEKKYGKIEARFLKEKNSIFLKKKNSNLNWKGQSYPNLMDNNINDIFADLVNSIKKSKNKKNIIIKFGNNYLKPFRKMINSIETDNPFILFNFSENDKVENDFFDKFKL